METKEDGENANSQPLSHDQGYNNDNNTQIDDTQRPMQAGGAMEVVEFGTSKDAEFGRSKSAEFGTNDKTTSKGSPNSPSDASEGKNHVVVM